MRHSSILRPPRAKITCTPATPACAMASVESPCRFLARDGLLIVRFRCKKYQGLHRALEVILLTSLWSYSAILFITCTTGECTSRKGTLLVHDVKDWRIHSMLIDGNDPRGWRIRRAQGSIEKLGSY